MFLGGRGVCEGPSGRLKEHGSESSSAGAGGWVMTTTDRGQ